MRAFVTHFPSPPPKLEIGSKACRRETPLNFRVEPRASAAASYISVLIIPTGMGASIGGYAGDAIPVLRLIASIADNVITHPNVLNGALMYRPFSNAMYVDGYTLDQFAAGRCALKKRCNRWNRASTRISASSNNCCCSDRLPSSRSCSTQKRCESVTGAGVNAMPRHFATISDCIYSMVGSAGACRFGAGSSTGTGFGTAGAGSSDGGGGAAC